MIYSKTAHISIIEEIAKGIKAAGNNGWYLELGIAKARCFNRVAPYFKHSCAVDINDVTKHISADYSYFIQCTTDEYFKVTNDDPIFDLIFIDANHDFKNVTKDFRNSVQVMSKNGIIILHDTYAPDKESSPHCKDAWKIQEFLKNDSSLQYINLPFYYGLTIVKKHTQEEWWER